MIATIPRQMKPSGVPWLGDIPAGGEFPRIHSLFFEVNEKYSPTQDGEMPLLSVSEYYGVAPRADKIDEDAILVRAESLDGYKKCQKGDIIINIMLAWKNALGVAPCSGIVSPAYCVYRSRKKLDARYFHHLFRTKRYGDVFRTVSTGIIDSRLRLYTDKFFSIHAPFPPLPEQRAIADFLDEKCAAIDAIVEEAKSGIEEYAKWKQSVIFQAVTKGLAPHAKMKDSGVEWIGEIPEEWNVMRVKQFFHIITGSGFKPEIQGREIGDYPVCKASDISKAGKNCHGAANWISEQERKVHHFSIIPSGSILHAKIGEAMKKNARTISRIDCCVDNNCQGLVMKDIDVDFGYYLFCCIDMNWFNHPGTIPYIDNQKLLDCHIPFPWLPEQRAIAAYLDEKCSAIDALIEEKKQLIEDLGVYKKSLIYETVTGKRKIA